MNERAMDSDKPREYHPFSLAEKVREPSYKFCLDWMRNTSGPHASYDVWARGNFTRRLLHHRAEGLHPLVVQVSGVPEMRWAYRRLALLGCPVDFIYNGQLDPPGRILHLFPWDSRHDCGWGYVAALDPVTIKGRKWFTVLGTARLMPESMLRWIVEEVPGPFSRGNVFVAPAELVGVSLAAGKPQLDALTGVTRGSAIVPDNYTTAATLMNLNLPYIDGMRPDNFQKFLDDHAGELHEFRNAFVDLIRGSEDLAMAGSRLEHEVAELLRASRHERLRVFVSKCKGSLTTFPVAMAALAAAGAAYSGDPFAGAAVLGAAGKTLRDLWKDSRSQAGNRDSDPYRILWKLGVENAPLQHRVAVGDWPRPQAAADDTLSTCHWLCPPTNGLAYLVVRK